MNRAVGRRAQIRMASKLAQRAALVLMLSQLLGCERDDPTRKLTLQVGPDQILGFVPKAGYAQYFEIPGRGDLLRIVLASYPITCHRFVPPRPGDVYLTVTVHAENGHPLVGEKIPWTKVPDHLLPLEEGQPPPSDAEPPQAVWALPMIRLAEDARPLPPGGHLSLSRLAREPYGVVEGEFHFNDASEGEAASAALLGPFHVQLCHVDLDPSRAPDEEESERPAKTK